MANFQWMIKILTASWSQLVVLTGVSGPHTSRKDSYLVRMLAIQVKVVVQFSALTTTLSAHSDKDAASHCSIVVRNMNGCSSQAKCSCYLGLVDRQQSAYLCTSFSDHSM